MGITAFCRRRRWVTGITLALYALVVSGLPLPLGAVSPQGRSDGVGDQLLAAKDRSRPFPCRDKPCGCVSADQCFKKCCCHTPAQLLAWAKRNDLEPAVLAALERRAATEGPVAAVASAASCCTTPSIIAKATCCTVDAPVVPPNDMTDCCSTGRAPATAEAARLVVEGDPEPRAEDEPLSRHTVVLKAMLACGGIVAEWFSIGGAPPPPAVVAVACVSPLAVTLVDRDESLRPRHVATDVPTPRVA
ncbi:MAG: hypothetical protein ACKOES_17535 [Planctomycetaceae bacterium]